MNFYIILVAAFGLSMDAFAVSITNGLCYNDITVEKNAISSALCFGIFQGLMFFAGIAVGGLFNNIVENIDHWIALILLTIIGGKMIYDGIQERRNPEVCCTIYSFKTLIVQGLATSIDAFVVGVGFAMDNAAVGISVILVALVTFVMSFIGVFLGKKFNNIFSDKAQFIGGAILIFIGAKIFYEHMFI